MPEKAIGLGAVVKVDHDDDTSFTTIGCVQDLTPPGRERAEVDATCLDDTLEDIRLGIEKADDFVFMLLDDPAGTNYGILNTLFGSRAAVDWQVILPFATPRTGTFEGRVKSIKPNKVDKGQPISFAIAVKRSGGITWA